MSKSLGSPFFYTTPDGISQGLG